MLTAKNFVPEGRDCHWIDKSTGMILVGRPGQDLGDGIAEANAPAPEPAPAPKIVSYRAFRARFAEAELQALFKAEQTDWRVRDLVSLAAADGEINLSGETAAAAQALLVALGVLTAKRAAEVFAAD